LVHQVGDLFELNVKLQCEKVKTEVAGFSKTLITIYQTTWHHIPEDTILHSDHADISSFIVACRIFPILFHHYLFIRVSELLQCSRFVWDVTYSAG
jgi:hypothetical protein